jgi:hypothetical protein
MVTVQSAVPDTLVPTEADSEMKRGAVVPSASEALAVHTILSPVSPVELTVIVKLKTSFPVTVVDVARMSSMSGPACGIGLKTPVRGSKNPGMPGVSLPVAVWPKRGWASPTKKLQANRMIGTVMRVKATPPTEFCSSVETRVSILNLVPHRIKLKLPGRLPGPLLGHRA